MICCLHVRQAICLEMLSHYYKIRFYQLGPFELIKTLLKSLHVLLSYLSLVIFLRGEQFYVVHFFFCRVYIQSNLLGKTYFMPTESKIGDILFLIPVHVCNKPRMRVTTQNFSMRIGNEVKTWAYFGIPFEFFTFLRNLAKQKIFF